MKLLLVVWGVCAQLFVLGNPVVAITSKKVGDDVQITWRLDGRVGAHDFIVQRSLDNQAFEAIGIVEWGAKRISTHTFGFVDENVVMHDSDQLYYRVVAVSPSGTNYPSPVTIISQKESLGLILDYFRVPEQPEKLFVAYRANGEGELFLQVFSPGGQSIFYQKVPAGPGFQVVEVPVSPNAEGTFRIQVFDDRYAVEKELEL